MLKLACNATILLQIQTVKQYNFMLSKKKFGQFPNKVLNI